MKKNFFRMFAAILVCGAIATVFTACSKDDDGTTPTPTPDQPQHFKAEVTLTFIAHPKALNYFEYKFKYVDANGNTKTIDINEKTQGSGSLDDFELKAIKDMIDAQASIPGYEDLKKPFVYRIVLKDQPSGGKVTFTTTCHVKEGASISETLVYALPTVIRSIKKGNGARLLASAEFGIAGRRVTPEQWEKYKESMEGKEISQASGEIVVGE